MLEIKNLNIQFDNKMILKNAHFVALRGKITIIKGKSGIGKSTFLKSLIFQFPCQYLYNGTDLSHLNHQQQQEFIYHNLSFVNQVPLFLDSLTIIEHIKQFEKLGYQRNKEIEEVLNIEHIENKIPKNLSGGERIRVSLYLSLMKKPDILILDEPTSSLDNEYTDKVIQIVKQYAKEDHIVIIASHDIHMIENGDMIYSIENYQLQTDFIFDKVHYVQSPYKTVQSKKYKKFNIRFGYRWFRIAMLCFIGLTMIIMIYSAHIYESFLSQYQNHLNNLSSSELLIYKPKYNNDVDYTYEGLEYPFTQKEIDELSQIEHIKRVDMHIDLDTLIPSEFDTLEKNTDLDDMTKVSLTDQNQVLVDELKLDYLTYHSYVNNEKISQKLSIQFQEDGIIIANELYQELLKNVGQQLQKPYLTFYLQIPQYNSTNITQIKNNEDESIPTNKVSTYVKKVSLPIQAVLKENETFYDYMYIGNSIFIENDIYENYITENYPSKERKGYSIDNGLKNGDGYVFYNSIPQQYQNNQIYINTTQSPWKPNSLILTVDHLGNIQDVINQVKSKGYSISNGYIDSTIINMLSENNKNLLFMFFISIVIIIYIFYIYLKYLVLKEEKSINDYLSSLGFTSHECQYIITKSYIKNFILLTLLTSCILYIFIEWIVHMQIIILIIPPRLEYFVFIIMMSFCLEILLPIVMKKIISLKKHSKIS